MRITDVIPLHESPLFEKIDAKEGPSRYWFVLGKDGLARTVNENDDELFALQREGWDVMWDSAKSPEEGLQRALDQWNLLPWDKDEPRPIAEPTVLYRSVSIAELRDILKTGSIVGKASAFNEFETRKWVFFGDRLSSNLIWQGEDHERGVINGLSTHAIHAKFDEVQAGLNDAYKELADTARAAVRRANERNAQYRARGQETFADSEFSDEEYARVLRGDRSAVIQARQIGGVFGQTEGLMKEIRALEDKRSKLRAKFQEIKRKATDVHMSKINAGIYSSAVIETKPITGGLHYSNAHGVSHFGSEKDGDLDEFTFPPGRVTVQDIARIHWVKDREIVSTSTVEAAPSILKKMAQKPKNSN